MPAACLGLSSGETNALLATGAWTDADDLFFDISRCGMYDQHLAGRHEALRDAWRLDAAATPDWRCYRVTHPVALLRAAIANRARVRLLVVHHSGDAVIGGEDRACRELIAALGAPAVAINHDLVVHCPELEPFAGTWRDGVSSGDACDHPAASLCERDQRVGRTLRRSLRGSADRAGGGHRRLRR